MLKSWRGAVATTMTWRSGGVRMRLKITLLARLINEPACATLKMITMENANRAKDNLLLTLPGT